MYLFIFYIYIPAGKKTSCTTTTSYLNKHITIIVPLQTHFTLYEKTIVPLSALLFNYMIEKL